MLPCLPPFCHPRPAISRQTPMEHLTIKFNPMTLPSPRSLFSSNKCAATLSPNVRMTSIHVPGNSSILLKAANRASKRSLGHSFPHPALLNASHPSKMNCNSIQASIRTSECRDYTRCTAKFASGSGSQILCITGILDDVSVYSLTFIGCLKNTEPHFRRLCERQEMVQTTRGSFG